MTPLNVYPSTSDLLSAKGDLVVNVLKVAYKRYREQGTDDIYIGSSEDGTPLVCAVGAVFASAGVDGTRFYSTYADDNVGAAATLLENGLRDAVIEAFRLLDEAAEKLYPEYSQQAEGEIGWSGPLEYVNQNNGADDPFGVRKARVLNCYKHAILARKADISCPRLSYFMARVNKCIRDALERDGFTFKVRPGYAEPIACVTDLYRMEHFDDDDAD